MNEMVKVICMDDDKQYYFSAKTGLEALRKMFYCIGLNYKQDGKFEDLLFYGKSGKTIYLCNGGKTYFAMV